MSTLNLLRDKDEIVVLTYNPDLIKDFNNTESENTIKIVRIEKEVDKTAAYNLSLDHAENPFLCFVDANTQLPTDYLTSIGRFTTNKKIGVIGPLLNISFGSQNISSYSSDLKIK